MFMNDSNNKQNITDSLFKLQLWRARIVLIFDLFSASDHCNFIPNTKDAEATTTTTTINANAKSHLQCQDHRQVTPSI